MRRLLRYNNINPMYGRADLGLKKRRYARGPAWAMRRSVHSLGAMKRFGLHTAPAGAVVSAAAGKSSHPPSRRCQEPRFTRSCDEGDGADRPEAAFRARHEIESERNEQQSAGREAVRRWVMGRKGAAPLAITLSPLRPKIGIMPPMRIWPMHSPDDFLASAPNGASRDAAAPRRLVSGRAILPS